MRTTGKHAYVHGHIGITLVAVLAALALGGASGFFVARSIRPSGQRLVDGLSNKLPVPNGAKLMMNIGARGTSGGDRVHWSTRIVLDITGMTQDQVEAIPKLYENWLCNVLAGLTDNDFHWEPVREEEWTQGLIKFPDGFGFSGGEGWTWRNRTRAISPHLFCDVYAEVMDFFPTEPGSHWWKHKPVLDLRTSTQGQRVMYIVLTVNGIGFGNTDSLGSKTWTQKCTDAASQPATKNAR